AQPGIRIRDANSFVESNSSRFALERFSASESEEFGTLKECESKFLALRALRLLSDFIGRMEMDHHPLN
ncbi:hypothetical protein, partial [Streptomyces sp. NPDC087300]|uniref:hypothetical protein n=1 Tax=Streptomyces sp. NPDC087300 TaxID=3365780 RepID=UPI0037F84A83